MALFQAVDSGSVALGLLNVRQEEMGQKSAFHSLPLAQSMLPSFPDHFVADGG